MSRPVEPGTLIAEIGPDGSFCVRLPANNQPQFYALKEGTDAVPTITVSPPQAPPVAWFKTKPVKLIGGGLVALLVGIGIGLLSAPTPASCLDALDTANKVQDTQASALQTSEDMRGILANRGGGDMDGHMDYLLNLQLSLDREAPKYAALATECRAA